MTQVRHADAVDSCSCPRGPWFAALAPVAATLVALAGCATVDLGPRSATPTAAANATDAAPRVEPLHPTANATYAAQGRWFSPLTDDAPFVQKGEALVYAERDHGKSTRSGVLDEPLAISA